MYMVPATRPVFPALLPAGAAGQQQQRQRKQQISDVPFLHCVSPFLVSSYPAGGSPSPAKRSFGNPSRIYEKGEASARCADRNYRHGENDVSPKAQKRISHILHLCWRHAPPVCYIGRHGHNSYMIGLRNHYTMDFHIFQGFLPYLRNLFEKLWSKALPSPFFDIFLKIPTFPAVRHAAPPAMSAGLSDRKSARFQPVTARASPAGW